LGDVAVSTVSGQAKFLSYHFLADWWWIKLV